MKTLQVSFYYLLIPLLALYGCQESKAPLTDFDIEEIKKEVRIEFEKTTRAANEHNAAAMLSYGWNSNDYLYVGNGDIIKGWEANLKMATSIHSDPRYQTFTIDYDEVIMRVISREAVMITGSGHFNNFPGDEGPRSVKFAVTYLYEKIDGKWLLTVGHESSREKML